MINESNSQVSEDQNDWNYQQLGSLEQTPQNTRNHQNVLNNALRNNINVKPSLQKNGQHHSDIDEWGTLNQTIGQRRKRGVNPPNENNQRRNNENLIDDSGIED